MVRYILLCGTAVGGPRSGVKLEASESWNGVVMKHPGTPYDGFYRYDGHTGNWQWHDAPKK
jgi:hypothetical protein